MNISQWTIFDRTFFLSRGRRSAFANMHVKQSVSCIIQLKCREVSVFYTTPQKYANVPMNIYKSHYFNINEGFQIIFLASTEYIGIAEYGELSTSTGDPIQWAESGLKLGYNPLTHNTLTKQFLLSKIQIKFSLE